jgi:hypothetical protein
VGFVVDTVTFGQASVPALRLCPVMILPIMHYIRVLIIVTGTTLALELF